MELEPPPSFMTLIYERIGEQYAPIDQVYQLNKGEAWFFLIW